MPWGFTEVWSSAGRVSDEYHHSSNFINGRDISIRGSSSVVTELDKANSVTHVTQVNVVMLFALFCL